MAELPRDKYLFDVARPQLLQKAGSIATAQSYNQIVEVSQITREQTKNPKPKSENARTIVDKQEKIDETKISVAENRGLITGFGWYTGSTSPYPRPNNYLYNSRANTGTTNFER